MMHPVDRVFLGRAQVGRAALLELASVVPGTYWSRAASRDAWTAREHLAHALSSDKLLLRILSDPALARRLADDREAALRSAAVLELEVLRIQAASDRAEMVDALASLSSDQLEAELPFAAPAGAWSAPPHVSLQSYLEQWASHDAHHAATIRRAISAAPDMATVARTRRLR